MRMRLKRYSEDQAGGPTVEFVVVAPLFFMFFFWVFETGIVLTKWSMLERGLDLTIREVRVNEVRNASNSVVDIAAGNLTNKEVHDILRQSICRNSRILKNCEKLMYLELTTVNTLANNIPEDSAECVNRTAPASTRPAIQQGGAGFAGASGGIYDEIVYVRACYWIDPIMPGAFRLLGVTSEVRDPVTGERVASSNEVYKKGFAITAKSSYVNEPT